MIAEVRQYQAMLCKLAQTKDYDQDVRSKLTKIGVHEAAMVCHVLALKVMQKTN